MNFVYFDIETLRLADEVGGWGNIRKMGIAVAVTLRSSDGAFGVFRENETEALLAELRAADMVVGFNSRRFDFEVLQPYVDFNLSRLPNLDLMLDVKNALGFRLGLNALCAATLGSKKTGDGLDAVRWWHEGRHDEVIEYCKADVTLTRQLHEYGATHGQVFYLDRAGVKRSVAVPWKLDSPAPKPQQGSLF